MLLLQGFDKNAKIPTSGQVLDAVLIDFFSFVTNVVVVDIQVYKCICLMLYYKNFAICD